MQVVSYTKPTHATCYRARSLSIMFYIIYASLLTPMGARAQTVAEDPGAQMIKVSEGVYAIIHKNATDEWPHGNSGVIVGTKAVMVVDANYLPSRSRMDIELIKKITDKPVRYVVITHWHFDHNNGTVAYLEAYPGVDIISEKNTQKYIEVNGQYWSRMNTQPSSSKRKALRQLEDNFDKKTDNAGNAMTDDQLASLDSLIQKRRNELLELENLKVVPPNRTFDKELKIDLGGKKVLIRNWGPANSPNDVTIYLPELKVLFAGDLLVQSPKPYTLNCNPLPWAKVLRQLEEIPVTKIIPGHGPVLHDHAYTMKVRKLLEETAVRVESMIREGRTMEEIENTVTMEDHYYGVWDTGSGTGKQAWKGTIKMLVERTWRNIRGQ